MNYTPPIYDNSDLEKLKDLKNKFVKRQDYDTAAKLRDIEKTLMNNIDRDNETRLKELEKNDSFTKEQVKSLLDSAVKLHEETIINLKNKINKQETEIKDLQGTVLRTIDLTQEFGEYLLKYAETYQGMVNNVPTVSWRKLDDADSWDGEPSKIYSTEQIYNQFLDWRFDPKNKADEKLDPDNGESLWVKTE